MFRDWVLVIVMVGIFAGGVFSAPGPKDTPAPPNYYPTVVGTRWVYDMNNGEGEQVREVTEVEEKDGAKVVTLKERGATGWVPAERVTVSARGLLLSEFAGYAVEPHYVLKFPIKAGDKWDFEYPFQLGLTGIVGTTTVIGEEEVTVPAGKVKAIKVERVIRAKNGVKLKEPQTITVWFASGIGRVKVHHSEGCDLALKSFTRGRQ